VEYVAGGKIRTSAQISERLFRASRINRVTVRRKPLKGQAARAQQHWEPQISLCDLAHSLAVPSSPANPGIPDGDEGVKNQAARELFPAGP